MSSKRFSTICRVKPPDKPDQKAHAVTNSCRLRLPIVLCRGSSEIHHQYKIVYTIKMVKDSRPSRCPRLDLIAQDPALSSRRSETEALPRFCTFDHTFHSLRKDEKFWYLKTKPVKYPKRTALEEFMGLSNMMQVSSRTCVQITCCISARNRQTASGKTS